MKDSRVSIKQIAELAGVSHPTVSRALSGQGRMSDDTRNRIVAIAQAQGYTPSFAARALVSKRSSALGLVVTDFADPFHSVVAQGVEEAANQAGYSIFLASASATPEREVQTVRNFLGHRVDGIIVSSGRAGNRYAELFQETRIPIVLINSYADGENVHSLCHDDYAGGRAMLAHLRARGYEQIAYIGNASAGKVNRERYRAWLDTMTQHNLPTALHVNGADDSIANGAGAMTELLSKHGAALRARRSAIWCYDDHMALGALSVLQQHGYKIPAEIGIAGFDNLDITAYTTPALTTWHQPSRELGTAAVKKLLELIENQPDAEQLPHHARRIVMQGHLVVRAST